MKISLLSDVFYPYLKGGAEKRYYEIFTRLAENHSINVYSMQWHDSKRSEIHLNMHVKRCHKIENFYDDTGRRKILPSMLFCIKSLKFFNEIKNSEIIECNSFPYFPCFSGKIFSFFQKIPLFITFHEVWDNYWFQYLQNPIFASLGKQIEKMTTRLPMHLIAVSNFTKSQLEKKMKIDPSKITVIPGGVKFEVFQATKIEKMKNQILYVGRLSPNKRIDVLISAIAKIKTNIPDICLHIVGTGPLLRSLEQLVIHHDLKDGVIFHGFLPEDDLIRLYKSSTLFVLPSVKEGFGIVLLEAMAAGTPIIAANQKDSATIELIDDQENGLLFKPNSIDDLADKIIRILKNDELRNKLIKNGVNKAKNYSWNVISKQVESLYKKFLR